MGEGASVHTPSFWAIHAHSGPSSGYEGLTPACVRRHHCHPVLHTGIRALVMLQSRIWAGLPASSDTHGSHFLPLHVQPSTSLAAVFPALASGLSRSRTVCVK